MQKRRSVRVQLTTSSRRRWLAGLCLTVLALTAGGRAQGPAVPSLLGAASTGALDLIGNVREIVEEGGSLRSVGGSYLSKSDLATLTGAVALSAEARPKDQGFRCARELVWKR